MLRIEAVQAREGDALIIHFGTADDPRLIVVDGGAQASLDRNPFIQRLKQLADAYANTHSKPSSDRPEALPIEVMVATHIDNDHLNGLLALCQNLIEARREPPSPAGRKAPDLHVRTLWLNGRDDLPRPTPKAIERAERREAKARERGDFEFADAVAEGLARLGVGVGAEGVPEANELLAVSERELDWQHNLPFDGAVRGDCDHSEQWFGDLKMTLLGPSEARLHELSDHWLCNPIAMKRATEVKPSPVAGELVEAAAPPTDEFDADDSPTNCSSIAFLLELELGQADGGPKTVKALMTGDALGEHLLEALGERKLLTNGTLPLDLLKLPHHGSDRNNSREFLKALPARHYLISADGKNDNPDLLTIERLLEARAEDDDEFTVHLTNREISAPHDAGLQALLAAQSGRIHLSWRQEGDLSLTVDLSRAAS